MLREKLSPCCEYRSTAPACVISFDGRVAIHRRGTFWRRMGTHRRSGACSSSVARVVARPAVKPAPSRSVLILGELERPRLGRRGGNTTVESARAEVRGRREEERVGGLPEDAVSERHSPQDRDDDPIALPCTQGADATATRDVKGLDRAVAEISDQEAVAEASEVCRRNRHAPGGVEK